jgi:hypothetical protein
VFPCKLDKKPHTAHGFKEATTNPELIKNWWRAYRTASIGIATGPVSGIFVIDIDNRHDGEASMRRLERQHGELPRTVEAITGSRNGRHLYFRWPAQGVIRNSAGKLGAGIDIRGLGGYVIGPPSPHESGHTYAWSVDSVSRLADPPDWLVKLITVPSRNSLTERTAVSAGLPLFESGVAEGHRNDEIARASGLLLRHDIPAEYVLTIMRSLNETHCHPPLPLEEVIRTSIAGAELRKRGGADG